MDVTKGIKDLILSLEIAGVSEESIIKGLCKLVSTWGEIPYSH